MDSAPRRQFLGDFRGLGTFSSLSPGDRHTTAPFFPRLGLRANAVLASRPASSSDMAHSVRGPGAPVSMSHHHHIRVRPDRHGGCAAPSRPGWPPNQRGQLPPRRSRWSRGTWWNRHGTSPGVPIRGSARRVRLESARRRPRSDSGPGPRPVLNAAATGAIRCSIRSLALGERPSVTSTLSRFDRSSRGLALTASALPRF